jgi:hypothetical protein
MDNYEILIEQLSVSAALVAGSTFIHAAFVSAGALLARATMRKAWGPVRFVRDTTVMVLLALWLMSAHLLAVLLWAAVYIDIGLFSALEPALIFSSLSYTSLGFGEEQLPERWGLLAGAEAATGLLMFGLSAALLIEAGVRLKLVEPRP